MSGLDWKRPYPKGRYFILFLFCTIELSCSQFSPDQFKAIDKPSSVETTSITTRVINDDCQGGEKNCTCSVVENQIIDGDSYDIGRLNGGLGGTPENVFINGGSENIPLTCHTALYLHDNRPDWIAEFLSVQRQNSIGFGGRELFSAAYFQQTAGNVLTAYNHALSRGHQALINEGKSWLRAYWAFLALTAVQSNVSDYWHTLEDGLELGSIPGRGYGVAITGTRNYPSQLRGAGPQGIFLAIALNNPNRDFRRSLNVTPGVDGALRAFLRKVGYQLNSDGKVNLTSRNVTSEQVGLTDSERATLAGFIQSNGSQNLAEVLSYIAPYKLACNMTFLRTSQGTISWFGTSTQNGGSCSNSKGGPYSAVSVQPSQSAGHILVRVKIDNNPAPVTVRRSGSQICASSTQLSEECISIPGGNTVYEVSVGPSGTNCVSGNCTGGSPPPPSVTTTTLPAPPPPGGTPPPVGDLPPPPTQLVCGNNALCLQNGRFKVYGSFRNQFNGASGTMKVIPSSPIAGYIHFGDPQNIELMVKVVDFGGTFKVFYGQLTNLHFGLYVKDMQTGTVRTYSNTPGDCGGIDQDFFA
ncbi:MAG: hypothetical protein KDD25_06505, partial [Bdellovibrionales bacterium]|nr:hypothetical protein [Bdellovibrionales bacterium]